MRKKVLLLFLLMALTPAISAQSGWTTKVEPADDLLGTQERTMYRYQDEKMIFAFYDDGSDYWKVGIIGDSFRVSNTHTINGGMLTYATIGLYDADNNIVDSWDDCYLRVPKHLNMAETTTSMFGKTLRGTRKVVPYLKAGHGSVRIVIETYGGRFDLRIPCPEMK